MLASIIFFVISKIFANTFYYNEQMPRRYHDYNLDYQKTLNQKNLNTLYQSSSNDFLYKVSSNKDKGVEIFCLKETFNLKIEREFGKPKIIKTRNLIRYFKKSQRIQFFNLYLNSKTLEMTKEINLSKNFNVFREYNEVGYDKDAVIPPHKKCNCCKMSKILSKKFDLINKIYSNIQLLDKYAKAVAKETMKEDIKEYKSYVNKSDGFLANFWNAIKKIFKSIGDFFYWVFSLF